MEYAKDKFTRLSQITQKWPRLVRILVGLWIAAGAVYFLFSSALTSVPIALSIAMVLPFLLLVMAFTVWNIIGFFRWLFGYSKRD